MRTLSKSDFKIARTCDTKLYYKELGYPSREDESELLELLAKGGYMVEKLAKLLYPDGRELAYDGGSEAAARATLQHLEADAATLFEATLVSKGKLARADILVKRGRRFELIEVKAKSLDSGGAPAGVIGALPRNKSGTLQAEWVEYVEDVAFQVMVLRELFPDAEIAPYLMLVDKSRSTTIDAMHQLFDLRRERDAQGRDRVTITFTDRDGALERIRAGDHFLIRVDVSREVLELGEAVANEAARLASTFAPDLTRIPPEIGIKCRTCEYRVAPGVAPSGFSECWGEKGGASPHVLDLAGLRDNAVGEYVQERIAAGASALTELDVSRLVGAKGSPGAANVRQRIQVENTRTDREWVSGAFRAKLREFPYPLRFIDFEASALCVPYHAGMHPYERVAFQWSCDILQAPGAPWKHEGEWINTDEFFPNFEFARKLCATVGSEGTVFMWHHFERNVLREIREQMDERGEVDPALDAALESLAERLQDQNRLCAEHYFHPRMGKSTSIKRVLDAVWHADPALRLEFPDYAAGDASPYDALPPALIGGERVDVAEGVGAMVAYQSMLYGPARHDPAARATLRGLLLRYCKLDTAAMVMIWNHWLRITA